MWTLLRSSVPAAFRRDELVGGKHGHLCFEHGRRRSFESRFMEGVRCVRATRPGSKGQRSSESATVTLGDARLSRLRTLIQDCFLSRSQAFRSCSDMPSVFQGISPADFAQFWSIFSGKSVDGREISDSGNRTMKIRRFPMVEGNFFFGGVSGLQEAVEAGGAFVRGQRGVGGKRGVVVRQMRHLPCTLYTGEFVF